VITYADGNQYKGKWVDGKRSGKGEYTLVTGDSELADKNGPVPRVTMKVFGY
jgi:hypothetical protein